MNLAFLDLSHFPLEFIELSVQLALSLGGTVVIAFHRRSYVPRLRVYASFDVLHLQFCRRKPRVVCAEFMGERSDSSAQSRLLDKQFLDRARVQHLRARRSSRMPHR